ncbi:phage holin family protein [Streptomyces sp. NPDC018057]|uniref:phage holin family protein n=1 Tax=unclassified Streptomyces TaxID=2593676 RepID=UPI0037AF1769
MTGTIDARPVRAEHAPAGDRSVGELVHDATEQLSLLARQEVALAKEELTAKGRRMGRGGGLLGAAGALAYVGLFALAGTGVAALSLVLPVWAAALIVTGVLFALAGLLALIGRAQLHSAGPPTPQRALGSVRADVEEIKERAHHR